MIAVFKKLRQLAEIAYWVFGYPIPDTSNVVYGAFGLGRR